MERAEQLRKMTPQLIADVKLYRTEEGGRESTANPGWGCPCMVSDMPPWVGWDAWPLLGYDALNPGDERTLGFVFLSPDGLKAIRSAGKFYLWEGRVIGEAIVVS